MKVIGAGVSKTGTKSLNAALTRLGYQVYDFPENTYYLGNDWYDIFQRGFTTEKFYAMYKDVDATLDTPVCHFWEELHQAFPEAKIILTVRDSEEVWLESLKNHIRGMDANIYGRLLAMIAALTRNKGFAAGVLSHMMWLNLKYTVWGRRTHLNESIAKMKYRAHNVYVMQRAPKDKLLVFNCKEGWEPICKFLDVPIPEGPFPHRNAGASMVEGSRMAFGYSEIWRKLNKEISTDFIKLIAKMVVICFLFMLPLYYLL